LKFLVRFLINKMILKSLQ